MGIANDVFSFATSVVRLGRGLQPAVTSAHRAAPEKLLELFDFENCPYCRKVREVLCELDLDFIAHPVAKGSPRRRTLVRLGGKMQVPYLVDPNTEIGLYESEDIIAYLNETYGGGRRAGWTLPVPSFVDDVGSFIASATRIGRGSTCHVTRRRDSLQTPTLFNMEGSPYCRKVREALSELDLSYIVRNVPKGSPKRAELKALGGKAMVPFLIDPNTATEMYESDEIVEYLYTEYGSQTRRRASRSGTAQRE